jgi:hypothetical protein
MGIRDEGDEHRGGSLPEGSEMTTGKTTRIDGKFSEGGRRGDASFVTVATVCFARLSLPTFYLVLLKAPTRATERL